MPHDSDDDEAFLSLTPIQEIDFEKEAAKLKEEKKKPKITLEQLNSRQLQKKAARYHEKQQQSGIVYIGRVPPSVGPGAVRQMLAQFGTIQRIFFKPESEAQLARRRQQHRASARRYECGWIEFSDKRHAKKCALLLNGQAMGLSTKSREVRGDLWMLQYLSKVKWDDLRLQHQHDSEIHNVKVSQAIEAGRAETAEFMRKLHENESQTANAGAKERRVKYLKEKKSPNNDDDAFTPSSNKKRNAGDAGLEDLVPPSRPPKPTEGSSSTAGPKKTFRKLL